MKRTFFIKRALRTALAVGLAFSPGAARAADVEALVYSTMPSTTAHRPEMALDGDPGTYFKSVYGMSEGDDFHVMLSRPIAVRSLRVTTGDAEGEDAVSNGFVETSSDNARYLRAATFDAAGVAQTTLPNTPVSSIRIRLDKGRGLPALLVREISIESADKISHVQLGPGRPFSDISQAPDLKDWARRADKQMMESWADTAAILYSPGFITPNKVNVVYKTGPGVTGVAAAGGGVITVNSAWARSQPNDTGLTVHEVAHVIQSMSAYNPVWLIEGVADYIRWVKFEPQNHKPRLDPARAKYTDSYRTTGTSWRGARCITTKRSSPSSTTTSASAATRQTCGRSTPAATSTRCGPSSSLPTAPTPRTSSPRRSPWPTGRARFPQSKRTRARPSIFPGTSTLPASRLTPRLSTRRPASMAAALLLGHAAGGGPDLEGRPVQPWPGGGEQHHLHQGQELALPAGRYGSLWILGRRRRGQPDGAADAVTYADGTSEKLAQNFSDWYRPRSFPGESRAVRMPYRNMANGARDARAFYAYSYGFALDAGKTVRSLTLPRNPNVKILAVTLAN
jgi:hypothetical protein